MKFSGLYQAESKYFWYSSLYSSQLNPYLRFQLTHSETAFSLSACLRPSRVLLRFSSKNLPSRHNKLYYVFFCSLSRRLVEVLIVNVSREIIPSVSKTCDNFFRLSLFRIKSIASMLGRDNVEKYDNMNFFFLLLTRLQIALF